MSIEEQKDPLSKAEQGAELLLKLVRRNTLLEELAESEKKVINLRLWLGSAAAVIFLICMIGWLIARQNYSNEMLAEARFQAYPSTGILKSSAADPDSSRLSQAIKLYDGGQYQEAIPLFRQIPDTHPNYFQVQVYLGNGLLAISASDQAIEVLQSLNTKPSNAFSEQATWYLGLAYLQSNQEEKARKILEQLATNSQDVYGDWARELLREMEAFWRKVPGI